MSAVGLLRVQGWRHTGRRLSRIAGNTSGTFTQDITKLRSVSQHPRTLQCERVEVEIPTLLSIYLVDTVDITFNDALVSVVDYDARDKIGASKPIGVTRSLWADGSQTLFAAADEVYPGGPLGTPILLAGRGYIANLNGMFCTAAGRCRSIAPRTAPQLDIDKDGNGYLRNHGDPPIAGRHVFHQREPGTAASIAALASAATAPPRSKVNLMTPTPCAGFESRTYPLKPYEIWDSGYYLPVSTVQDNSDAGKPIDARKRCTV